MTTVTWGNCGSKDGSCTASMGIAPGPGAGLHSWGAACCHSASLQQWEECGRTYAREPHSVEGPLGT